MALHKNATQNNVDTSYVASNAVDGDHDRIRSCIRTEEDLNTAAWWMVDLGADYIIYNITITTRNINAGMVSIQHSKIGVKWTPIFTPFGNMLTFKIRINAFMLKIILIVHTVLLIGVDK